MCLESGAENPFPLIKKRKKEDEEGKQEGKSLESLSML